MIDSMHYKGYTASMVFDPEDQIIVGRILGVDDNISFHGESVVEFESRFHAAIEDYLAASKELGSATEKPASAKVMLFALIFTDKPGHSAVRASSLQAHIEWLELNQALVPIGGSLRHEPGDVPKGGLWIAQAESKSQLEALIKSDPFYIAGLRQSYEILHWSKANAERMALI